MRVVAGELRSRRLHTVAGRETRPTSDRARAGLFDWLGPRRLDGARVLDLFAGTGALGIEALSRGASEAVFVERARGALRVLRRNLDELGLDERARVVEADLGRGLRTLAASLGTFDLVLADPPYDSRARGALLSAGCCRASSGGRRGGGRGSAREERRERAAPAACAAASARRDGIRPVGARGRAGRRE
jgi:16S rRNA (guanine(966)-N(2))-methyltransferase RsmD